MLNKDGISLHSNLHPKCTSDIKELSKIGEKGDNYD